MTFLVNASFAVMALGVLVASVGRWRGRVRRAVSNTPVSAVEDVTEPGPVAVHGTATKSGLFDNRAPFSSTTSLVAAWSVQQYGNEHSSSNWQDIESGHEAVPFVLEDDTGEVAVDLTGEGDLDVDDDELTERHRVEPGDRRPKAVEVFEMKNDDVDPQRNTVPNALKVGRLNNVRRYSEALLVEGDECYLLGEAQWREDVETDANETVTASSETGTGSNETVTGSSDEVGDDSRELVVTAGEDTISKLSTEDPEALRGRFNWSSLHVALGVLIVAGGGYLNLVANGVV